MDREKVIKGLEYCKEYFNCCNKCPYWDGGTRCTADLAHDALALLKEQEGDIKKLAKYCYNVDVNALLGRSVKWG